MSISFASTSSRFASTRAADELLSRINAGEEISVQEVVSASGELPNISPERLTHKTYLGQGTSFRVSKELYHKRDNKPYYVAVKRFITSASHPGSPSRRYASFLKEFQVLMHPPLRTHGCIVQAIACGWDDRSIEELQPYLVLDYSDHGTLSQYLKRCETTPGERRELALDVTSALKSLHDCGVIHGDVKLKNVLIYDNDDPGPDDVVRSQVAKLSDFSSSLFSHDFQERSDISYDGTPKYLAPEGIVPKGNSLAREPPSLALYAKSDIYSLGLLIWETVNNGESYINSELLLPKESPLQFLERIFTADQDAVRHLALSYFQSTEMIPASTALFAAVREATIMCLFGDPWQREDLAKVRKTLAGGTREERPRHTTARNIILPPEMVKEEPGYTTHIRQPLDANQQGSQRRTVHTVILPTSGDFVIRPVTDSSYDLAKTVTHTPYADTTGVSVLVKNLFDVFKVAQLESIPWAAQKEMAHQMNIETQSKNQNQRARSHLQLSVMYHIGFGVEQQDVASLEHLRSACEEDSSINQVYLPVMNYLHAELSPKPELGGIADIAEESGSPYHSAYVPRRIGSEAAAASENWIATRLLNISLPHAEKYLKMKRVQRESLLDSLTATCREGQPDKALLISRNSRWEPVEDTNEPNFCHWLIKLDPTQAQDILENLDCGGDVDHGKRSCLNQSINSPLYSDEHNTQLFGTPLHWAVHAGNIELVSILIAHGADVNVEFKKRPVPTSEPNLRQYQPNITPLDLAVQYHFADIAKILLEAGSKTLGGDHEYKYEYWYSVFHVIGADAMPFARPLVHGEHARSALRKTIKLLRAEGLDINAVDAEGETPLTLATRNPDTEPYIVEGLLEAGARPSADFNTQLGNMIIRSAAVSAARPASSAHTRLLLPLVDDLNALNPGGLNALHYCAVHDAVAMASVLLGTGRVDVDGKSGSGLTPLMYAAHFGSEDIIDTLRLHGADLTFTNKRAETALEVSVRTRHLRVAAALLRCGVPIWFKGDATSSNIMHCAVTNASQRGSIAKDLLEQFPSQLGVPEVLNAADESGWTPLHIAAYFGDYQGVEALLDSGADSSPHLLHAHSAMRGLTPLELVRRTIKNFNSRNELGQNHNAVKKKGILAVEEFVRRLDQIRHLLEARSRSGISQ